jgi:hypothetical protein
MQKGRTKIIGALKSPSRNGSLRFLFWRASPEVLSLAFLPERF